MSLSGWSLAEQSACPVCNYETAELPLKGMSEEFIMCQLESLPNTKPGKNPNNRDREKRYQSCFENWMKKRIFFELDYWSKLKVRHSLDVMCIEMSLSEILLGHC